MSAVDKIDRVLRANVLRKGLTYIPQRGATDLEVAAVNEAMQRPLSTRHTALLRRWNGLNLEVVFGADADQFAGEGWKSRLEAAKLL
jgi:hypothetical protein